MGTFHGYDRWFRDDCNGSSGLWKYCVDGRLYRFRYTPINQTFRIYVDPEIDFTHSFSSEVTCSAVTESLNPSLG